MPNKNSNWTEDETILALALYYQLKPNQFDVTNPEIIELSKLLGRTPGSVSFKLQNLLAADTNAERKGLSHGSHWDRELTQLYCTMPEELFEKAENIMNQKGFTRMESTEQIPDQELNAIKSTDTYNEEDSKTLKKYRKKQYAFRRALLTGYNHQCCISRIGDENLLIASHIKPWCDDKAHRGDPTNGLLLNALLDRAFDRGIISINPKNYTVMLANRINDLETNGYLQIYKDREITLPKNLSRYPSKLFLEYHNDIIFEKYHLGASYRSTKYNFPLFVPS